MKIKQGFILHRIGDDYIIMQDGSSNVDFSKVISLNQTSAMLWQEIENKEFDTDSVTEALTSRYDVDNELLLSGKTPKSIKILPEAP